MNAEHLFHLPTHPPTFAAYTFFSLNHANACLSHCPAGRRR